jgi:hypothetical protein
LPFLLPVIAILIMSWDPQLFLQCWGRSLPTTGRMVVLVRFVAALPCTPVYVRDLARHGWVVAIFVAGVASAVPQIGWLKRHGAYWDSVRAKARLKRAEKRTERDEET